MIYLLIPIAAIILVAILNGSAKKAVEKPDSPTDAILRKFYIEKADKKFAGKMVEGEHIVAALSSARLNDSFGTLALTNKRILFKGDGVTMEMVSVALSKVGQVRNQLGGSLSNSYIFVEYTGGDMKFEVNDRKENDLFTNECQKMLLQSAG